MPVKLSTTLEKIDKIGLQRYLLKKFKIVGNT
jgi:hypothetical protein